VAPRTELGQLREGQVLDAVQLSQAEAAGLNATRLVSVQPGAQGWRVTAAYAVGVVRCGDLVVRVHPKVGPLQVLRLLARAHGIRGLDLDDAYVDVAHDDDLTAALAVLFAAEATRALATGPLRGYRTEDQTLAVVRGRLRLREQELRRYGMLVPLEVTVDEWTADTDENRRIRAACRRLLPLTVSTPHVHEQLVRVDRLLADVTVLPAGAMHRSWVVTRLNARLHRLLHLADLVLDHATVEHRVGDIQVHGYVLSMSWLFERLIGQLLTEAGGQIRVEEQATRRLDRGGLLTIKPDLLFVDGREVVAVADTKYKLLDDAGRFPNADAYQLVTYSARLGLEIGHLIYAAGDPRPDPFDILGAGVRLVVHSVELNRALPEIESRVRALFDNVVALHEPTELSWASRIDQSA
jgi:5-methylcytosine-specific restriction enzyme subunit McrC